MVKGFAIFEKVPCFSINKRMPLITADSEDSVLSSDLWIESDAEIGTCLSASISCGLVIPSVVHPTPI